MKVVTEWSLKIRKLYWQESTLGSDFTTANFVFSIALRLIRIYHQQMNFDYFVYGLTE